MGIMCGQCAKMSQNSVTGLLWNLEILPKLKKLYFYIINVDVMYWPYSTPFLSMNIQIDVL